MYRRILFVALTVLGSGLGLTRQATAAPEHPQKRVGPRVIVRETPGRGGPRAAATATGTVEPVTPPVATATTPTSSFIVAYDAGFNANPAAKAAFQAAVDVWSGVIVSPVPIRVAARFAALEPGVLGAAGPQLVRDFGAGQVGVWYPQSLAESIVGREIFAEPEISAEFNSSSSTGWYFGTDGRPTANQIDFMTVALHELGHGLGHIDFMSHGAPACPNAPDGAAQACFPHGPMIFDKFTRTVAGSKLMAMTSPSKQLAAAITTPGNIVFDGPATNGAGGPVKLYTPSPYEAGSSVGHLENAYDGTANALMTPSVARGEVGRPGLLLKAMLKDIGYRVGATSYQPMQPTRLLDTRLANAPLAGGQALSVQVRGIAGVPTTGVDAVVLNVTTTGATAPSYFTVWPTGVIRPLASNLNFGSGGTAANLVVAKVGAGGTVSVFNAVGLAHVIVDLNGWMPSGSSYNSVTPNRILDTRPGAPIGEDRSIDVPVTNIGGVPSTGVSAVLLNVTVAQPTASSHFTVWPAGQARPTASNLNFVAGQAVPNLVLAKVGTGGRVSVYNAKGSAHVVVDVQGWLSTSAEFVAVTPSRLLDTRPSAAVNADGTVELTVAGRGGVPASGATAVVLNVTAVTPTAPGYLTVWPSGARPTASNLNFVAGQVVPNLVIAKVGGDGKVRIYNSTGSTHVVADVLGYTT